MAAPKKTNKFKGWADVISVIKAPLGFYVLALLIVESPLAIVLSFSKLTEEHVWEGFKLMIWVLAAC
jgi:phosphoribosylcarboxyaminoimidazole (NCAIR) mutase